ncbi:MAG: DeoR/GlpR family DNA-binding transcription regulator [Intrasporangium sp.]|uniref:DeoR/GlpR family DNA-binding transcription regulator n=1 Tax=Intrasporangium sp. TaxID=1925024 RepID=UPI002648149D|nr:DeoR/GlpR family DNA-binding transcription regulator [Intrasporangium sp.]MDN5797184.1 DeoR/GlpR family DNA-binding transcription regulator [Intrasporangium sp.]
MTENSHEAAHNRAGRWSAMLDRLATSGRLGVSEAADLLGVSEATIRRDFGELAKRQLVTRHHGGIVATSVAYELPYRYRSSQADAARRRIAAAAAGLISAGQVVGLNGGTTTTATARAITAREDLAGQGQLTIVTNALNIASEAVLRPHVQCVSLGGVARPESYELTGPLAQLVLEQLWLDTAVVGLNGLTAAEGATCRLEDEAAIIRLMIARSRTVICVATGDKLGQRTFASICPADRIDHLVTTADAPADELAALRTAGITIHTV